MNRRASNPTQRVIPNPAARMSMRGRPLSKLRTIDEAAELFNASPRTVRRLIESGALPVHRLGRLVRISDDDIAAFLAANRSD
jgi:excisionase family DNA binding protein